MPVSRHDTVLSRYRYDPLDRQTDCTLLALPTLQRFYCTSRLATEIQGALRTSVFQHDDQLLAQQRQQDGSVDTTLLATDQQRSVLGTRGLSGSHFLAYSPYGHRPAENGRTRNAALKELANTINVNEREVSNSGIYNVSDDTQDITKSNKHYEAARHAYNFDRYPNPGVKEIWSDPHNNNLLDVAHFDITRSHYRNLTQYAKVQPSPRTHPTVHHYTEVLRAIYIKNHTGIDLMKFRQEN